MKLGVSILWVVLLAVLLVLPGVAGCSNSSSPTSPTDENPPSQDQNSPTTDYGKLPGDRVVAPSEGPILE